MDAAGSRDNGSFNSLKTDAYLKQRRNGYRAFG